MIKDAPLSVTFLNSAGGDKFNSHRKFLGHRTPKDFATRLVETMPRSTDFLCLAECPGMGSRKSNGNRRSVFLNTIIEELGHDLHVIPQRGTQQDKMLSVLGLGLITRLPILSTKTVFLESPVIEPDFQHPKGALRATFNKDNREMDLIILHFTPLHIIRRRREFSSQEQGKINHHVGQFAEFLTPRVDQHKKVKVPTIVIGDFNVADNNQAADSLLSRLEGMDYIEAITGPTVPGSNRKADRVFVTEDLSVRAELFNADSDHLGISALVVSEK